MVRQEGGRWDVGIKDDAVFVQRVAEGNEQLFADSLAPDEARELAGLLSKFADKLESENDSDESQDSSD